MEPMFSRVFVFDGFCAPALRFDSIRFDSIRLYAPSAKKDTGTNRMLLEVIHIRICSMYSNSN